jgi:hypothetical protein
MRHNPDRGIMAKLMETGAVVVDLMEESRLRRHPDVVLGRHVKRLAAADPEIRAGRRNDCLGLRYDLALRCDRRGPEHVLWQALALRGIEDGEALEERNDVRVPTLACDALQLGARREAVGVADRRAALALADMTAQGQRLPEGQPLLGRKSLLNDRAPEDQHIDAGVGPAGGGVLRQAQRGLGGTPGLHPGHPPLLQLPDDPVRYLLIEARPSRPAFLNAALSAALLPAAPGHGPSSAQKTAPLSPPSGVGGALRPKGPPAEASRTERPERSGGPGARAKGCGPPRRA